MSYSINTNYHFVSHSGSGACMNVYGNDTVSQNRKVCLWAYYDTKAQKFQIRSDGKYFKIVSSINTSYALNAWRKTFPYACDVYPYVGNEKDARIQLETVDATNNLYKIRLLNYPNYLTAPAVIGNNGVINWAPKFIDSSAEQRQIWKLTTSGRNLAQPTVEKEGHLISYAGKGGCLNVYGNEVISPNRRTCIWSWDVKNAQYWGIGRVSNKLKVFSSLGYPRYALNAWRGQTPYICDVYPHTGNDSDSTIVCEPVNIFLNTYRIRLQENNLYLTAMGSGNGSAVVWRSYVDGDAQVWKITTKKPESNVVPGEPIDNADSPVVTTVLPIGSARYTSRNGTKISEITIHHMGYRGTVEGQAKNWSENDGTTGSHYAIKDNTIGQYVREINCAYTNGPEIEGSKSSFRAVTIEVANSQETSDYPISDESFASLVKLVADIAKRNGLEKLTLGVSGTSINDRWTSIDPPPGNLTWHSMYSATKCPGNYLRSRLQELCDKANKINGYS